MCYAPLIGIALYIYFCKTTVQVAARRQLELTDGEADDSDTIRRFATGVGLPVLISGACLLEGFYLYDLLHLLFWMCYGIEDRRVNSSKIAS